MDENQKPILDPTPLAPTDSPDIPPPPAPEPPAPTTPTPPTEEKSESDVPTGGDGAEVSTEDIEKSNLPPVFTPPPKPNRTKLIAAVAALLLLVLSIPAGVFLVQQRQETRKLAATAEDCKPHGGFREPAVDCDVNTGKKVNVFVCNDDYPNIRLPGSPTGESCDPVSYGKITPESEKPEYSDYIFYDCDQCTSDGRCQVSGIGVNPRRGTGNVPDSPCRQRDRCRPGTSDCIVVSFCATECRGGGALAPSGETQGCVDKAPGSPTLLFPGNGSVLGTTSTALKWAPSGEWGKDCQGKNLRRFDVYLWKQDEAKKLLIPDRETTSWDVPSLSRDTTYNWQVVAYNDDKRGNKAESPTWAFTTTRPSPPPPTAECKNIKIYDENWKQIAATDINQDKPIRVAVSGTTTDPGGITKAAFRINNGDWEETDRKNSNGEFYLEFVPKDRAGGKTSLKVEAVVFNPKVGWK